MDFITTDHRYAIALAAENLGQFTTDLRRLYLLLGVIVDRLEGPAACPDTAAALASIARDWIMRDGQLDEARECIRHLQRDFPVLEVGE